MYAKELRIGNYVSSLNDISEPATIEMIGRYDFGYERISDKEYFTGNSIEPIPLTEEWLLKFGFEKIGSSFYHNAFKIFIDSECYYYGLRDEGMMDAHIEYVHQLQNLHISLTQTELIIK